MTTGLFIPYLAAAGPAGQEGWKQILATIEADLGDDIAVEHHHLIGEGDLVATTCRQR